MYTVFEPGTIRRFYARQRGIRAGKCTLMDVIGWRNSARTDLRVLPRFFCQQNANTGVFLLGDFLRFSGYYAESVFGEIACPNAPK
jgi:hypothetical protein